MSEFYPGQIVFDKKRTDITDDLLVVVNADAGTVDTLDPETKHHVETNETNKRFGVRDSTEVVEAAYLSHVADPETDDHNVYIGGKVYTYPKNRLATITSRDDDALNGYQAYQWAVSSFLSEIITSVRRADNPPLTLDELQVLCMKASIDGEVITRATEMARD